MTWAIPDWWTVVLLALAAFRTWRLIGEDTILDGPRERFLVWFEKRWAWGREWLTCPWCAGAEVAVLWWFAWIAWDRWTLIIATPLAISAVVGFLAANLDPD